MLTEKNWGHTCYCTQSLYNWARPVVLVLTHSSWEKRVLSYFIRCAFTKWSYIHVSAGGQAANFCLFVCLSFFKHGGLGWFVGCLTSQQHASVSQGQICSDSCTCFHTEIEVADQTFYLAQSQYTETGLTSPSANTITPGAWQGSHWSATF